jgi:hypothetical protein
MFLLMKQDYCRILLVLPKILRYATLELVGLSGTVYLSHLATSFWSELLCPMPFLSVHSFGIRSFVRSFSSSAIMAQRSCIPILLIAGMVQGHSNVPRQTNSPIDWTDCEYPWDTPRPLQCAKLSVPLDYTDESGSERLELDLVKIAATKEPVLGSMLINPGGPGVSGVESAVTSAESWLSAGGGQYNLIGFDPRGTGRTMPLNCTPTEEQTIEARDKLVYSLPLTVVLAQQWDGYLTKAASCGAAHADNGHLYGTVFVARDMLQIVDALDEDGLLRYYGEYGILQRVNSQC